MVSGIIDPIHTWSILNTSDASDAFSYQRNYLFCGCMYFNEPTHIFRCVNCTYLYFFCNKTTHILANFCRKREIKSSPIYQSLLLSLLLMQTFVHFLIHPQTFIYWLTISVHYWFLNSFSIAKYWVPICNFSFWVCFAKYVKAVFENINIFKCWFNQ